MADELISRQALLEWLKKVGRFMKCREGTKRFRKTIGGIYNHIEKLPAVDAVELSAEELKFLINDTIAYIWRMEDSGRDKPEFGYDSRKALLEKLKQFGKEHFPEMACSYGERREENGRVHYQSL